VGECFFWYRPTRVVPDQKPLNGRCKRSLYYLQNRKAKTLEQVRDLLVSDRIKETLSPACLRHVLSTEETGWFGPEKLTEVIDTYENIQRYLPGKYSKF